MAKKNPSKINFNRVIAATSTYWGAKKANDEEKRSSFLSDALDICENFFNTLKFQSEVQTIFKVSASEFAKNLKNVVVEFANWSQWKENYSSEIALSWIDKQTPESILINEIFWERYRDLNDQEEKKRILFIVSLCIVHELGHSLVQWSTDPNFKEVKVSKSKSFKEAPGCIGNAGRCLEMMLFYQEIVIIIQGSSKSDWSAKSKIIEVSLDFGNDRYSKIDDAFIAQLCAHGLNDDDLFRFKLHSKKRIPKGQVALQTGENDEEESGIKSKARVCGTRLLFPHESDEESDEDDNEN